MDVNINIRGNGACPICAREQNCGARRRIAEAVRDFRDPLGHGMELVVYACPLFKEKM